MLIKKNDASGVAAVFRLIEDSDDQIRSFVVRKFIEGRFYTYNRNLVATAAVMVLIERLGDPIWYVRYNAMMALAWGNHHRLFDLSDLDDQSRQRAVQAAKRNLDDDNPLFQGQPIGRDNRDRLEWAAIDAMAALDDPYGIELLIEVRDGKRLPGYRKDARKLIDGLIRDPQALITLVSRLKALEPDFRANVIISMNAYEGLMLGPDQLSLVSDLVSDEDPEVRTQISNLLIRHRYADGTPALINQLKEEQTPGVIVALASALRALANRDSATKVLIERLQDDDADIRVAVVQALGATGGVLAMEALERTLKDQDVQVRYASAEALGLRGKTEVVPLLIDYLNSLRQNYELADLWANQHLFLDKRTAMVKLLGTLGDPQAIAVLSEQLDEPRGDVAVAAVMALNQIGTAEAMEIILDGLNRRRKVAHACIKAITQWNNDEATEALISGLSSPDQMLRRDAAQALGQLGDPHAVPALIERLDDSHSGVQAAAIEALGTIGAPRALSPILQELKNPNSSVREAAVRALSDLGDPAVLPALRERIKDENTRVHITATTALGTLGDKNAVDLLVGNLGHRRNDVRAATAAALGQIGDKRAVEPLVAVLNDKTARIDVRAEALMAIGHIRAHQANGNHKFAYDHDHRLDRTISVIGREVRKALDQGRYSRGAVVTAAVSLMAFDPDESLALLQELIDHGNTKTKVSLAKRLGAFHTDAGAELLVSDLLPDHDPALRQQAIESLGRIKAERALPEIQRYLSNGDVAIRVAAAEALGRIASHEGIEPLKQVLMDQEAAVRVRLQACKALRQIGSRKALDSLFEALKEDKEDLLGAYVYYWLGGIPEKRQDVMAFMRERLEKIDRQYEQWRLVRDSEPAAAPKADQNDDGQHQASQPPSKWLFELGYGIAKLSPGEEGIQALQHNLTEVRLGAIAALGDTGDIAMLDNLIGQYDRIDQPLLRHATYRVMDGILATLQNNGTAANLQELKALRKMLSGKQDLEARLKWIINQAEEMDT